MLKAHGGELVGRVIVELEELDQRTAGELGKIEKRDLGAAVMIIPVCPVLCDRF
jgi:hypothetical protein